MVQTKNPGRPKGSKDLSVEGQNKVVELRKEGKKHREIATLLGINQTTVSRVLIRAGLRTIPFRKRPPRKRRVRSAPAATNGAMNGKTATQPPRTIHLRTLRAERLGEMQGIAREIEAIDLVLKLAAKA